jgi:hypothetical protein
MEGIGDLVWLKHLQRQQFVSWSCGEGGVLLGGQGTKAMAGLRCDDDTGAAGRDDVPELFEPSAARYRSTARMTSGLA